MDRVFNHLNAALKILEPKRDELKSKYGDEWPRFQDAVLYHNMCADINEAVKLASLHKAKK